MTANTIHVFKTADEPRSDLLAGFADDAELVLPLEEGAYWIEVCIISRARINYAREIRCRLQYSGALYDPGMHVVASSNDDYYLYAYEATYRDTFYLSQFALDGYEVMRSGDTSSTTFRGGVWYRGRITCLTAGDLTFNWMHWDNGFAGGSAPSNPSIVFAGSWMYATPLDICPIE